jgi:double-stranded uracil-DNA glycosylase
MIGVPAMANATVEILPDVLVPNLRLVFCGTAAGRISAATKSYYAHPQNQFWRTLAAVGLTPRQLQPHEYRELLHAGIGLTDLAKHHAGMDADIPATGFDRERFVAVIRHYQPQIVAFTSKKAGQFYFGKPVAYGWQTPLLGHTRLFVVPSPSPAARGSWDIQYWQMLADAVRTISGE